MTKIVVISAGLSQPSSTRLLADRLAAATRARIESAGRPVELEVVELRSLAHALADNLVTGFASGELADAIASVASADAVIAITPIFSASYSGLFKTFVDVLDKEALTGQPVLIAATAGTARHSLALEHALRPLFAWYGDMDLFAHLVMLASLGTVTIRVEFHPAVPYSRFGSRKALSDHCQRAVAEGVDRAVRGK